MAVFKVAMESQRFCHTKATLLRIYIEPIATPLQLYCESGGNGIDRNYGSRWTNV